jgi:hypothetical protein
MHRATRHNSTASSANRLSVSDSPYNFSDKAHNFIYKAHNFSDKAPISSDNAYDFSDNAPKSLPRRCSRYLHSKAAMHALRTLCKVYPSASALLIIVIGHHYLLYRAQ